MNTLHKLVLALCSLTVFSTTVMYRYSSILQHLLTPARHLQPMDRIAAHFNRTNIQELQRITRKYFDRKRDIIDFSDFDMFVSRCNAVNFTLLYSSSRKSCDVVHTPIGTYGACAIVGNGGILLNSSCGAEIDAHEFVIRSNLPPTHSYENDVGSITNLTTINQSRLKEISKALRSRKKSVKNNMMARLSENPGMVFSYPLRVVKESPGEMRLRELKMVYREVWNNNLPIVVTFSHQSSMASSRLYEDLVGKTWTLPSTGLNTFALASTFCDRVSLYGFYPLPTYENRNVTYHYYDRRIIDNPRHRISEEFEFFQDLHDRGVVRHVIGKCNLP